MSDVQLTVNGQQRAVDTDPNTPLLYVLRNDLGLVGSRFGCGLGLCGACFVRVDGAVVASCDTPMWSVEGKSVVTVEGLAEGEKLHRVQEAVLAEQAAQCGYCVSGVLVSAAALLERDPHPDEPAVIAALERNLCRCGVQRRMVRAIVRAGELEPSPGPTAPPTGADPVRAPAGSGPVGSPPAATDSPATASGTPAVASNLPRAARGTPAIASNLPRAARSTPAIASDLPAVVSESPRAASESPAAASGPLGVVE